MENTIELAGGKCNIKIICNYLVAYLSCYLSYAIKPIIKADGPCDTYKIYFYKDSNRKIIRLDTLEVKYRLTFIC